MRIIPLVKKGGERNGKVKIGRGGKKEVSEEKGGGKEGEGERRMRKGRK